MAAEISTAISFDELKELAAQRIADVDEDELPSVTDDDRGIKVAVAYLGGNHMYLIPSCREHDGSWTRCEDYISRVNVLDISTMDELENLMCDTLDLVG